MNSTIKQLHGQAQRYYSDNSPPALSELVMEIANAGPRRRAEQCFDLLLDMCADPFLSDTDRQQAQECVNSLSNLREPQLKRD